MSVANLLKMAPPPYRGDKVVLYAATDGYVYVRSSDGTFQLARQSEVTTALTAGLATKAATSHGHAVADTTGLQTALDAKEAVDAQRVQLGTPVTLSGTSADFAGIPSGTRKITVGFNVVSTNGSSALIVQLGDAGGPETSGYTGSVITVVSPSTVATAALSSGFQVAPSLAAASVMNGQLTLVLLNAATFLWSAMWQTGFSNEQRVNTGAGVKSTSQELDRIRITTVNGTDAFDAGSVNIAYER